METIDELCSYMKGYLDGIMDKRIGELESRISKLEKRIAKLDNNKSKPSTQLNKEVMSLRGDLKQVIKELSENNEVHSAKLDDVYLKLKTMNYSVTDIGKMIDSLRVAGEILLPKNNTIKLV